MRSNAGFTLVELVVVTIIIGILLAVATLLFSQLSAKYAIESDVKEMYGAIMKARNDAALTNTPHLVVFDARRMRAGIDADSNRIFDGTLLASIDSNAQIVCGPTAADPICAGDSFLFDRRGVTNDVDTIRIANPANVDPAINCITIANTRINMGRIQGGNCVQQ